jgi:hypothetical protein
LKNRLCVSVLLTVAAGLEEAVDFGLDSPPPRCEESNQGVAVAI